MDPTHYDVRRAVFIAARLGGQGGTAKTLRLTSIEGEFFFRPILRLPLPQRRILLISSSGSRQDFRSIDVGPPETLDEFRCERMRHRVGLNG